MPANNPITELDFAQIKNSLKEYLNGQDYFTDYDFDGSALSILLDLLAYNTHYMGFYANMVSNEMFLDSAVKRSSLVSLAKHLGYTPQSIKSPNVVVNIKTGTTYAANTYLPAYSTISGGGFSFVCVSPVLQTEDVDGNGIYEEVTFYEGEYRTISYLFDAITTNQKFTIPDRNADMSTLRVVVQQSTTDSDGISDPWVISTDVSELNSTSEVYFLQQSRTGFYEIYFGDGVIGKKPENGNVITLGYIVTDGEEANNIGSEDSRINRIFSSSVGEVEVVTKSSGGAAEEDPNKIRETAPLFYQSQNRAVTKNDYLSIIQNNFSGIESINIYGGEDSSPPQYGKVFLSIKPTGGTNLTDTEKQSILSILKSKNLVSIIPEVIDPEYTYLRFTISVVYDPTETLLTSNGIKTAVIGVVENYVDTILEKFNEDYIHSKISRRIDNIDNSIIGNEIKATMEKRIVPNLGDATAYNLNFKNKIYHPHDGHVAVVRSNSFRHKDSLGVVHNCYFEDNGYGSINLYRTQNGERVLVFSGIGNVDYEKGLVSVNNTFVPVDYVKEQYIRVTAVPDGLDIITRENNILTYDSTEGPISVTVLTENDRREERKSKTQVILPNNLHKTGTTTNQSKGFTSFDGTIYG